MIKPWIALAAIVISTSALHASEPITPTDKTNVVAFVAGNNSGDIEYRHLFLNSRLAVIALAGYHEQTDESSGPQGFHLSQHSTELGLGVRHNFTTVEQIRPFVQLTVARSSGSTTGDPCGSGPTFWDYTAVGGGEYFVGRRVSLEGSAGLQVGRGRSGCFISDSGPARVNGRSINTFRTALGMNFYF